MTNHIEQTHSQSIRFSRLQAWAMSFICIMLCFFAAAAATRIPNYLETADYARLIGVILFGLLTLAGLIDNIHTHACLWRMKE